MICDSKFLRQSSMHVGRAAAAATALLAAMTLSITAVSQERTVPDTFTAITTNMQPAGLKLKIDVTKWSSDDERAAVVEALQSEEDVAAALEKLPSGGAVWREGSAVGHSVKYAHREKMSDGTERITIVTDAPLDSYSFQPWELAGGQEEKKLPYAVVELHLDASGNGSGSLSIAADVEIDDAAKMVTLAGFDDSANRVLTKAKLEPKPYWAKSSF